MKDSPVKINYTYDGRNRLTSVRYENGILMTYRYDPVGNLIACNVSSQPEAAAVDSSPSPSPQPLQTVETPSICPGCGKPITPGKKVWTNCGTPLSARTGRTINSAPTPSGCTACGNPIRPGAKFCAKCGRKHFLISFFLHYFFCRDQQNHGLILAIFFAVTIINVSVIFMAAVSKTSSYQKNPFLNHRPHENHKERIDEVSQDKGINEESDDLEPLCSWKGILPSFIFFAVSQASATPNIHMMIPGHNKQEHAVYGSKKYRNSFSQAARWDTWPRPENKSDPRAARPVAYVVPIMAGREKVSRGVRGGVSSGGGGT